MCVLMRKLDISSRISPTESLGGDIHACSYLKDFIDLAVKRAAHKGMCLCLYNLQTFWMLNAGLEPFDNTCNSATRIPTPMCTWIWVIGTERKNWTYLWLWTEQQSDIAWCFSAQLIEYIQSSQVIERQLEMIWKEGRGLQQFSSPSLTQSHLFSSYFSPSVQKHSDFFFPARRLLLYIIKSRTFLPDHHF